MPALCERGLAWNEAWLLGAKSWHRRLHSTIRVMLETFNHRRGIEFSQPSVCFSGPSCGRLNNPPRALLPLTPNADSVLPDLPLFSLSYGLDSGNSICPHFTGQCFNEPCQRTQQGWHKALMVIACVLNHLHSRGGQDMCGSNSVSLTIFLEQ